MRILIVSCIKLLEKCYILKEKKKHVNNKNWVYFQQVFAFYVIEKFWVKSCPFIF